MHEAPREVGIAQNSYARCDKVGTAENSGDQPASCLMRSARRPKASFTHSSTLGAAPCVRSESLKASRSDSHCRCRRPSSSSSHETPGELADC